MSLVEGICTLFALALFLWGGSMVIIIITIRDDIDAPTAVKTISIVLLTAFIIAACIHSFSHKSIPVETPATIVRAECCGTKSSIHYKVWLETPEGKTYLVEVPEKTFGYTKEGVSVTLSGKQYYSAIFGRTDSMSITEGSWNHD